MKRQELELDRVAGARGELPTVLRAHNEEVRALKVKVKKVGQPSKRCVQYVSHKAKFDLV